MQCRLILIRHGESVLGSQGRYAGRRDTLLTRRGQRQIVRLRKLLARYRIHHIYSSDLRRCVHSAEILAGGRPITVTQRLRELDFGAWEGKTWDELKRLAPTRYPQWLKNPQAVTPPRGESLAHLARRVRAFASALARRHPGSTLALVTHGGPIRVLVAPTLEDFWAVRVRPASMKVLAWPHRREEVAP